MANEIVFKTKAFGGFSKREVMDFVNNILNEKSEAEKKLADLSDECAKMRLRISEMDAEIKNIAELKAESERNAALNTQLRAQLDTQEGENAKLLDEISEKNAVITGLQNEVAKNTIDESTEKELEMLRSEVRRLKVECEKKNELERQVGAAMLDARLHSEELVEAAREKANGVTKSVYAAIGETAVKIDDLSAGIGDIARSFTKSVEEVELRIKALTGDMSKTAQLLISETGMISDSADADVEYDFAKDNGGVHEDE